MRNLELSTAQHQKWLVLIGIDFYMPGDDRHDVDGGSPKLGSLNGCVRDVHQVQEYFETQLKADPPHILALTSTKADHGNELPREERKDWPTYENIVILLERVAREGKTGDLVYIHYSGHGARVKTSYPNLKGPGGYDEAIAPLDIACGGQYLLDVELAILLDAMVKKGLILTIVLDCCHSGSATRDGKTAVARGIDRVDETASHGGRQRLIPVSRNLTESLKQTYRGVGRELWLDPQGYELMAACRLHETAHEDFIEGEWHGVLTYHLLRLLKSGGLNLTHGMLYRRLQVQITQDWNEQTPVFAGNSNRYFFGSEEAELVQMYAIKKVNENNLTLDAGRAHGIMTDSEYAIYPWNADRFDDSSRRPKARVIKVGELESTARLFDLPAPDGKIEPGFQALPLKSLIQKLAVKFLSEISDSTWETQFGQLQEEVNRNAQDSPVQFISDLESGAKYHIAVDIANNFTLLDTVNQPVSNFPRSNDPKQFHHNLRHLARYEMLRNLKNSSEPASLKGKYSFEIEGFYPTTSNETHRVRDKSTVTLKFTNKTGMPLNITIFNFQPLWGIEKVFPGDMDYETVLNDAFEECKFVMSLPENRGPMSSDQIDCFKVFITKEPTSFKSLELLELGPNGATLEPGSTRGENDLDALLAELDIGDRKGKLVRSPKERGVWGTSEVEVCTIPGENCKVLAEEDVTNKDHRAAAGEDISSDNEE